VKFETARPILTSNFSLQTSESVFGEPLDEKAIAFSKRRHGVKLLVSG
jgi:hypothetical protein